MTYLKVLDPHGLTLIFDFVGHHVDVLEIRLEDSALVGLSDLQHEASVTILFDVVSVGPGNGGAEKVVLDGLVGVKAENNVVQFMVFGLSKYALFVVFGSEFVVCGLWFMVLDSFLL